MQILYHYGTKELRLTETFKFWDSTSAQEEQVGAENDQKRTRPNVSQ